MGDMLSRAQFKGKEGMVSEDEEVRVDIFESAQLTANDQSTLTLNKFNKTDYDREWLLIRRFLSTMTVDASWTKEKVSWIQKKVYNFFL